MDFAVTVVERGAKRLFGMKTRTSMRKASEDCPALWRKFGPRLGECIAGGGRCGEEGSYGVSVMVNENDFDYWAAVEALPASDVPAGFDQMDLPAGKYARCGVPGLERLSDAYMLVYGQWAKSSHEYALDESAPCFELYPMDWCPEDAFEIFVPVKARR